MNTSLILFSLPEEEDHTGLGSGILEFPRENDSTESPVNKLRHDGSSTEASLKGEQKVGLSTRFSDSKLIIRLRW